MCHNITEAHAHCLLNNGACGLAKLSTAPLLVFVFSNPISPRLFVFLAMCLLVVIFCLRAHLEIAASVFLFAIIIFFDYCFMTRLRFCAPIIFADWPVLFCALEGTNQTP